MFSIKGSKNGSNDSSNYSKNSKGNQLTTFYCVASSSFLAVEAAEVALLEQQEHFRLLLLLRLPDERKDQ